MNNGELQQYTEKVDELVNRLSALPDSDARRAALELLQSLMDLHGAALSQMVELLSASSDWGRRALEKLGSDPLICGLLVLYGIHPVALPERVAHAVERVQASLSNKGAELELLAISNGVVRLHVQSSTRLNPDKLRAVIQQAILEAAPEIVQIAIEGLNSSDFVPIGTISQPAKEENIYEESAP